MIGAFFHKVISCGISFQHAASGQLLAPCALQKRVFLIDFD
jgi:hypothetical protein